MADPVRFEPPDPWAAYGRARLAEVELRVELKIRAVVPMVSLEELRRSFGLPPMEVDRG